MSDRETLASLIAANMAASDLDSHYVADALLAAGWTRQSSEQEVVALREELRFQVRRLDVALQERAEFEAERDELARVVAEVQAHVDEYDHRALVRVRAIVTSAPAVAERNPLALFMWPTLDVLAAARTLETDEELGTCGVCGGPSTVVGVGMSSLENHGLAACEWCDKPECDADRQGMTGWKFTAWPATEAGS